MIAGTQADLQAAIDANPIWYHTLELAPGVVTPGWFDLRRVVHKFPWPDVRGKRCLDVGTYDGFLAFELERRGAAEVVALDIPNHEDWDWPPRTRAQGPERLAQLAGPEKGVGFRVAREALGASVEKVDMSVYELSPERVGKFDIVVCGSLMLHLRDPLRALEGIRSVCEQQFMSIEQISLSLSARHPRLPVAKLDGVSTALQWWIPNLAGHRQMVSASGFEIERAIRPYSEPFGPGHPAHGVKLRDLHVHLTRKLLTGNHGVPHAAVLARPVV